MIAVIGAGAFGTALSVALARVGPVTLWARKDADVMESTRQSSRLPDVNIPDAVRPTADLADCQDATAVLLAIPTQQLSGFLAKHGSELPDVPLVGCCKGIDVETGHGPTRVMSMHVPHAKVAILTGPSFAADIARFLPTALTLACADETIGHALQLRLSTPTLRLYRSQDVIGAELGGALKNVIAIGCGAVIGAGLGTSARAALMTRGFAEIQRLAMDLGAEANTLQGLSGFGDLALTCTSEMSRNFRFGASLGAGQAFDPMQTVEGAATAQAVARLAEQHGLDLPVCITIAKLASGHMDVQGAMDVLLARPLKAE